MTADDRDYYLRRASEEDAAARAASSLTARWRHEELAGLHRMRAAALERELREEAAASTAISADVVPAFILIQGSRENEAA